jgi:serine/threonine-protein kinase
MKTSERWRQIKSIHDDAIQYAPDERARFLKDVCGDDNLLRREVESLLSSYSDAENFMEQPAVAQEVSGMSESGDKKPGTGKCFGHYEIIKQIGAGGMGEVYLAQDKKLDRRVAVKILNERFSRDESNLRRFTQEAKAASALNHPNILVIHEIGEAGDAHFIVSELVEGNTLREIFNQSPLKSAEVLDVSIQIAGALAAAHAARIIHRDIKPENIIVRPDGYVKILDFGLAKLVEQQKSFIGVDDKTAEMNHTAKGVILGTANYMSPEQARGEPVDERTDIFSFGVLLYEMISGRTPFVGNTVSETFANLMNSEPQPLARYAAGVSDELQRIVSKMLRKNKDKRYQTMKDVLTDLKDLRETMAFGERLEKSHTPGAENATNILQAATDATNFQTSETRHGFSQKIKQHKSAALAVLITSVAALAVAGYFAYTALRPRPPITSVAVLPFQNGSGDASLDYLSDGLSESVIDRLSQLAQLKVIARSSSFKYRGENIDFKEVANKLGVRAIVTGRIIQRGDNLSIRVEMIDARDNRQLWSEQYNRRLADAIAVQQEIARTVSEELRLKLSEAQEQQITKRLTNNSQAYQFYLNGVFLRRKGGTENVKKSLEYQNQALALDPNFALAYTEVARGYNTLVLNGVLAPQDGKPKARAAIEKALELDETLAEVHLAKARIKRDELDRTGAEREYRRAIELSPNLADAYLAYSIYLIQSERMDEALRHIERAQQLDPLRVALKTTEGNILYFARRYDEAIQKLQDAVKLEPDDTTSHYYLGYAYTAKGQYAEAIGSLQTAAKINGETTSTLVYLGQAYAKWGKRDEALGILDRLKTTEKYVSPAELAILYTALGDKEKAFALLEKAYTARDLQLQFLKVEPGYDALRDDPRFTDLLRRADFPQ